MRIYISCMIDTMKRNFTETLNALCSAADGYKKNNGTPNITALSSAIGINQATLHRMLIGESREPKEVNAGKICKFFSISREQMLGKEPILWLDGEKVGEIPTNYVLPHESNEYVAVPFKEVRYRASMDNSDGFEIQYDEDNTVQPLFYRRDWIEKNGYKEKFLVARQVSGSSMEPALFEGDKVLVNLASTLPKNGMVFALLVEGNPVFKRLRKRGAEWWITSDNQAHEKTDLPLENNNQILGEAVEKSSSNI